jgi:hypothetical protein
LQAQSDGDALKHAMPDNFNFLDIETLADLFKTAGFLVGHASYFRPEYYYDVSLWDGREGIGIVGVKADVSKPSGCD